ncbi:DUF4091 domain-containing protein [Candidatus Sumerlaeota bacterium]|nr:DUF4091 domain-containing protein [Candidatus Sumerlaeota bacterium]
MSHAEGENAGALIVEPDGVKDSRALFWLESSLKRVYPQSPVGEKRALEIITARNRNISLQACVRNERIYPLNVECSVSGTDDLKIRVRRVGYVPMHHLTTDTDLSELEGAPYTPGLVPDPLFPENKTSIGPYENQSFWITITIPRDAKPGTKNLTIKYSFHDNTQSVELKAKIDVRSLVIEPRKNFPVIHWWRPEDIYDYHNLEPWSDEWYKLAKPYLENLLSHGSDVIFVPAIYPRREYIRRPAQMLKVTESAPNKFEFDFTEVRKFIRFAKECGFEYFEWPHLWIYWGVKSPMRVYKWVDGKPVEFWPPDEDGFGERYMSFLRQFLPELHKFLMEEKIEDKSYFHISDEPGGDEAFERYTKARQILRDLAPWMKIMDALSEVRYGKTGIVDFPIPIVSTAQEYVDAKLPHWVYYCCGPRGPWLNRFFDTPLTKIRMSGWLFYKLKADGFLHWGYNYWRKMEQDELVNPFADSTSACWPGIPYGDPFVVYPGADGPIDSIRWEVFSESLEDFAMLQTMKLKRENPLLSDIKTYADFPKNEEWINQALATLLEK